MSHIYNDDFRDQLYNLSSVAHGMRIVEYVKSLGNDHDVNLTFCMGMCDEDANDVRRYWSNFEIPGSSYVVDTLCAVAETPLPSGELKPLFPMMVTVGVGRRKGNPVGDIRYDVNGNTIVIELMVQGTARVWKLPPCSLQYISVDMEIVEFFNLHNLSQYCKPDGTFNCPQRCLEKQEDTSATQVEDERPKTKRPHLKVVK